MFQKLFHFPGETQSGKKISELEEECIPRNGGQTCKLSECKSEATPGSPSSRTERKLYTMLCAIAGANATCLLSLRAFRNPGFRHRRAALRPVNWTDAGNVHTRAFLEMNRANLVQRRTYRSAHPEQRKKVVCSDLLITIEV